jgi:phage terminase large subunit-like protein
LKKAAKANVNPNWITEYWSVISDGREIVSSRVRQLYARLYKAIERPIDPYIFDPARAVRPIEFIETVCKHSKAPWQGKPLMLELWQKAAISALFGFVHKETGIRQYRRLDLFVARKNGKSTLAAGIGLYMLTADGEGGAEVYSVATKKDQAKIIWQEAKNMAAQSPVLRSLVRRLVGEIAYDRAFSSFRALASESNSLDGLNTHCCFVDELHAIKDKNLIDVIVDSMTARTQPVLFVVTTMGTVRESVFDDAYDYDCKVLDGQFSDPHILPIIYELDPTDDWQDESCWKKANPALGTIKSIDQFRAKVDKAINKPNEVKNLLCKDFNRRQTSTETWLSFEQLHNPETFDLASMGFSYGIGGADLSTTTDLTAAKLICMKPNDPKIYVMSMYWLPEDLIESRTREDKVPYDLWYDRGLLRTTPGNKVHADYVTRWFREMRDEYGIYMTWCGYDRWSADYWVESMKAEFGAQCMQPIAQGKATLSGPMNRLGRDLEAKLIIYNANPIDVWCLSNTCVDMDVKNGTIQPAKGRDTRRRIDGFSALLDAYVSLENNRDNYMNMI